MKICVICNSQEITLDERLEWTSCDFCQGWIHSECLTTTTENTDQKNKFYCLQCIKLLEMTAYKQQPEAQSQNQAQKTSAYVEVKNCKEETSLSSENKKINGLNYSPASLLEKINLNVMKTSILTSYVLQVFENHL
ncbi:uncharacterized protein BX663DRAFT_62177 [Cokeromyces recurvatus]|uniref:uncharacterized protein n=1 Tax=Cokeromyces recurvatus TaxID=90255 RepID=UPI00221FD3EA|nr:uncharacterized protein BX663DRAFT_62177 [Cokeromyces recurvatus]KAI7902567.1 hypothetical protein BX663DRAFT_62177 [Cokeromyces recurvatus]